MPDPAQPTTPAADAALADAPATAGEPAPEMSSSSPPDAPRWMPPLFDAGWLLLVPGIAIVAIMVLMPALEDRDKARFYRDRARLAEQHSQARLANHSEYLGALKRGDEAVIRSLAATQLNKAPAGMQLLKPEAEISASSAAVYDRLEPPALVLNEYQREYSTLEKLALGERSRLWVMGLGAFLIFAGLLPASRN